MKQTLVGHIHKTGFYPPIINHFLSVEESAVYNIRHELRHPGAIFNITSSYLINSLSSLIDTYTDEELYDNTDKVIFDKIFDKFRLVIYDLFKFYDSCFEIMACFCDAPTKPIKFIDRWLKKEAKVLLAEEFEVQLKEDKSFIYLTYNKLKHTSNTIAWANLISEQKRCIGYYLEAQTAKSFVGSTNDSEFPISLNRQIRNIYFFLFKISETLCNILKVHTASNNIPFAFNTGVADDTTWCDLYYKVESLDNIYLPSETGKLIYFPFLENEAFYFIEDVVDHSVSSKEFWENDTEFRLNFVTSGDNYSKKFSHPHMGLI
ncbi:hypothetical protein [Mucilaginibacter defluvii]